MKMFYTYTTYKFIFMQFCIYLHNLTVLVKRNFGLPRVGKGLCFDHFICVVLTLIYNVYYYYYHYYYYYYYHYYYYYYHNKSSKKNNTGQQAISRSDPVY